MRLKHLKLKEFKNLTGDDGWFNLDFTDKDGTTVLIGNNGSGKSNVIEAISAIFTGLYKMSTPQRKPKFQYEIQYTLDNNDYSISLIKSENDDMIYNFHKNLIPIQVGHFKSNYIQYLPLNIIAIYSGEEMRLWENYYKHSYKDFMKDVKGNLQGLSSPKLIYVNKYYWNISLLSLLYSELPSNQDFCKRILDMDNLSTINITMKFNMNNITNFADNSIVSFVKSLNLNNEVDKVVSIEDLRNNQLIGSEKDLFLKLMASVMDKASKYKLIEEITITFQSDLTTELLSEGEKKQILIRTALEVIADTNSLILLDEPDSHIHIANKTQLKDMLLEYDSRDTILTTHSPTLMNIFDEHLVYLEDGKTKGKEKAEILKEISGDLMSIAEQQIVLNSSNDILLVEGKTDIEYIQTALNKLNSEYNELSFEYIPFNGTSSLVLFIEKFKPKDNQKVIAFLDRDDAGKKALKQVFGVEKDITTFNYEKISDMYIAVYPIKDDWNHKNFLIEHYFDKEHINQMAKELIDKYNDSFNSYPNISKQIKSFLPNKCKEFPISNFNHFKKLFELIRTIKDL